MKIIDFTSDCIFLSSKEPSLFIKHYQTGPAVMHSGCPKQLSRLALCKALVALFTCRFYDWVILPPVHLNWQISNRLSRRLIKNVCSYLMKSPLLAGMLHWLIIGSRTKIIVIDYSDLSSPSDFALKCFQPKHYFQLNIHAHLVGKKLGVAHTTIHYLPTIIQDTLIDDFGAKASVEREFDVFVAGYYHNIQREKQRDACLLLAERGWKVYELTEKSFEKFSKGILNSLLCMSGRGLAYHCFRPLEAAAAGAAPICHEPEEDQYHEYVHELNAYLYSPLATPSEIADFVETILLDKSKIPSVVHGARSLLNTHHRASVLAANLLNVLSNSDDV